MGASRSTAGGTARVSPLQASLLEDPVAFLSAEHARQTVLLGHLERVARAPRARGARSLAHLLIAWLTQELPVHIADEEGSLYPRLAAADAAGVLAGLHADHVHDREAVHGVVNGLRAIAEGKAPETGFAAAAAAFAARHRRHLAIEEESVAPLARRVLSSEALRALADEMARRRSLASGPGGVAVPTT